MDFGMATSMRVESSVALVQHNCEDVIIPKIFEMHIPTHKNTFIKSRSKLCYPHFSKSREKVYISESGSGDWVDQIVWNFDTSKINILTQCVSNFVQIGLPGHMKKTVFQRVVSKRCYRSFAERRKKANLSESGSGDWLYQILPPRQIKSTVWLCGRIKNRRRQIQTFDQNNN